MSIMTKADLMDKVAEKSGESKAAAHRVLDALQESIMEAVADGKKVNLTGFASFEPSVRTARTITHPQTKESLEVSEKNIVKIRPMSVFRKTVSKE